MRNSERKHARTHLGHKFCQLIRAESRQNVHPQRVADALPDGLLAQIELVEQRPQLLALLVLAWSVLRGGETGSSGAEQQVSPIVERGQRVITLSSTSPALTCSRISFCDHAAEREHGYV